MTAALVVDPATYTKQAAVQNALAYTQAFLVLNGIPPVSEYLWEPDDAKKPPGDNPWHGNGWCWQGTIFVNVRKSRVPVKVPGFQWSYTGFKADLTAPGIIAHETGHHVHFEVDKVIDAKHRKVMTRCLRLLQATEAPVSGYEPNSHEVMAEMMRLFILNPKLLEEGRPKRYEFLRGLGLKPLHDTPWQDVLVHAHPRIIAAAQSWIEKGR